MIAPPAVDARGGAPSCEQCGHAIEADPDGSAGVWVHPRALDEEAYDLDSDHAARPPEALT